MASASGRSNEKERVVLLGDARMAFAVAKGFHRLGYEVHASVSLYSNYLEWSRFVTGHYRHAPLEPGDDLALPGILAWIDSLAPVAAIQPVGEASARMIARHRAAFEARAPLIAPAADVVDTCYDKAKMFALCETLDVALAKHRRVTSLQDAREASAEIGFPQIVKPSSVDAPLNGRKALIMRSAEDFREQLDAWPPEHPDLIVQRYVRGPRHNVIFSAHDGRLLGAVELKSGTTDQSDGTGHTTYAVSVAPNPAVKRTVERLVEALGYDSTGCAQFIVDPDGEDVTFMELNPRVSLARLAEAAGLPHVEWGVRLALSDPPAAPDDPWSVARIGVDYVWTYGDLKHWLRDVREKRHSPPAAVARLAGVFRRAVGRPHAVFDWTDPAPAFGVYFNWLIRRTMPGRRRFFAQYADA